VIHTLLNLTRPLILFDCETTGVKVQEDRILELGFQQWTSEGMVKEWRSYINPLMPIPPQSTEIHGITDEFIKTCCRHCQKPHEGSEDHEWAPLPLFKQLPHRLL